LKAKRTVIKQQGAQVVALFVRNEQCNLLPLKAGIPGTMERELTEHPGFFTACAYHIAVLLWVEGAKPTLLTRQCACQTEQLEI
jgi:hypothetical protein